MVTTVVNLATDPLKISVPYSTANKNRGLLSFKLLEKNTMKKSTSSSPYCIPVSEEWLLPEWSYWANHTVVISSAQQKASTVQ